MNTNQRIKALRKELNLSQPKFGEKLGVSRDVIANIELERVEPRELILNLICKTFNVNPLWLSDGEGEMFTEVAESLIEDLCTEYNLSTTEKKIICNFINLPKSDREKIIELTKKLIK